MARTNPLGKIKDLTVGTLKLPKTVADKAVGQAKDAAATGLHVADQVTRSAVSTVGSLVQQRRGAAPAPESPAQEAPAPPAEADAVPDVDTDEPVNVVEELGLDPAPVETPRKKARKAPPRKATTSIDAAADPSDVAATPADLAEKVAKAPARKTSAKKAPVKKTSASKTTAGKTTAKKSPATKAAASKSPASKSPAGKAAKKSSPSGRLPARKRPLTAAELAEGAGPEVITPVGTRGAGEASNPNTADTDLQQPGTEPLMDPSTTKAVASEQATLSRAADPDKG